ncbi:MAG: four helix bundle protein [Betaproteobacteria bacterium]
MVSSYQDLSVWQRAMELAEKVFALTADLPREQMYGLSVQMQRAVVSVPSNIAEGHARDSTKEYLRFVSIALGSLAELETQLMLCERLKLLTVQRVNDDCVLADEVGKMLRGVQRSLKEKLN